MAYTTIDNPGLFFNTVLYTGNGSTQSITGVGYQPDWVWLKKRNDSDSHYFQDAARGATKAIKSNSSDAEVTDTDSVTSFNSDGFSLGNSGGYNSNTNTFVAWNWKAGGAASSNSDGSITSTVSANTTAGISIVSYTGTGSNATVGHGLGVAPKWYITKNRDTADNWLVYHESIGNTKGAFLNLNNAPGTSSAYWNDTSPTSTVFSVGTEVPMNKSGDDIIAYCFAEKKGYSKFGSYTGNGNADGTFIYTGFRPAWVIMKRTDTTEHWLIKDSVRDTFNVADERLFANLSQAEGTSANGSIDILSNGFKQRGSDIITNASGGTYIFMAFAEAPFVTVGTKAAGTAR